MKLESNAEIDYTKQDVVFKNVLRTDEGEYVCEVKNNVGSEKSKPATLHVYGKLVRTRLRELFFRI